MQAVVINAIGKTEFTETAMPDAGEGQVLLAVRHVGLCGSDLNTFCGLNPLVALPRIPGHEIGATILSAGAGVPPAFQPGASVIVIPYTTCGSCSACRKGRVNACRFNKTLGVQQDGGLAQFLVARHDRLILNNTLPPRHLALVEPLSVGFHAVQRGGVMPGETVVVLGGGMIGVGVMLGALTRGARVIAVEPSPFKQQALRALGVEAVLDPRGVDLGAAIDAMTDGLGPDVVIEAVGLPETFRQAVDLAGFAGRIVYVGYAKAEVSYNTSLFNLKELGIFGSRNATRDDFNAVVVWLEQNAAVAERLISKVFPWDQADRALGYWEAHRDETFKVMIDLPAD